MAEELNDTVISFDYTVEQFSVKDFAPLHTKDVDGNQPVGVLSRLGC